MTLLVGMLAFSIDIGYICAVEAELQNAADAAALAGAQQMQTYFVNYYSPGQTQQQAIFLDLTTNANNPNGAIANAQQYAAYNKAGGVNIQVPASDISFSYYDGTTFTPASYPNFFPNTITVTTRRDNVANGPLGLFFAQIFGMSSTNMTASASATIYAGDVSNLQVIPGVNAHILPVALDVNVWTNFMNANWTSPWLSGVTTTGPNDLKQLQVYITSTNTPGSFGLIDLGPPANNAPAFRTWIDNGTTPNDINYLLNNNLLPVTMTGPAPWKAGPGLTSTLLSPFQSVMGEANLIPLFMPQNTGPGLTGVSINGAGSGYVAGAAQGSNASYSVVGFASITVTQADGSGGGLTVSIQPMAINDPTAVILNPSPARASQPTQFGTSQTTFISAKLTQ
jgi:Flp pilus assembly protein TadG